MADFHFDPELVKKIADHVRQSLKIAGEDISRDGLRETPERVARKILYMTRGNRADPNVYLEKQFEVEQDVYLSKSDDMVIISNIHVTTHCEHHLSPIRMLVDVAYIPNGKVVGLSKIVRVVETLAARLQIQERMTYQIADTITNGLHCKGVIVVTRGVHFCMVERGVEKERTYTICTSRVGLFKKDPELEKKFQSYVNRPFVPHPW
jgi:GTP cyclohydrolase I